MAQPLYACSNDTQSVAFGLHLAGLSSLPVSAQLSVSQRHLSDGSTLESGPIRYLLSSSMVSWAAGETGARNVTLTLTEGLNALGTGALVVTIVNATNADLGPGNVTSVVSAMRPSDLTTTFEVVANEVRISRGGGVFAYLAAVIKYSWALKDRPYKVCKSSNCQTTAGHIPGG